VNYSFNTGKKALVCRINCHLIDLEDCTIARTKSGNTSIRWIHTSSTCVWLWLILFKIFHKVHCSKVWLSKMSSNVDGSCERYHMSPWSESIMFVILRPRPKYFKIKVDVCPSTAIFEVSQSCRVDFQHSIVLYSI